MNGEKMHVMLYTIPCFLKSELNRALFLPYRSTFGDQRRQEQEESGLFLFPNSSLPLHI